MTRRYVDERSLDRKLTTSGIVIAEGAPAPSLKALGRDAILVSVAEPPLLAAPTQFAVTSETANAACLSLADVAHHTHARDVHSRDLFLRGKANGNGVRVAVVDTGFAWHSFFDAYRVTRLSGPYSDDAGNLGDEHGTAVLSNLLVCAPGVDAFAVKYFDPHTAFVTAMLIPDVRVISLSWGFPIGSNPRPDSEITFEYFVQVAVTVMRITVVVATGFLEGESTPARLQEVTSVGGAIVDSPTTQSAWGSSASFISTVYGERHVPDLCGIATEIDMPVPAGGTACDVGSTSCATPQVAAIAALLLQKNPTLSPSRVRKKLMSFATDIKTGHAYPNVPAGLGPDDATGAGFVNALASWKHVVDAWWTLLWPWS
jgi:subtilisin family serine protease